MKPKNHSLFAIMPLICLLTACSTSSVTMQILVPGQVSVTQDIKNVGIINRSLPSEEDKFGNVMEGFFTGETIFGDREGSMNCIRGLGSKLNESPRFNAVMIEGLDLRGTGVRKFPPPLSWKEVNEYCERFKVDGLIVLEVFDSNINLEQREREVEKEINKKKVKVKEYHAEVDIEINAGWRGYDPIHSDIFDQDIYMDGKSWSHTDDTREKALYGLPDKRIAINEAAYNAGFQYALRISPTWLNTSRQYYKSGNSQMEIAYRCVKTKNWNEAESLWEKAAREPDPKLAGRATYNLILAREMDGDLPAAAQWAKISYQDYGNKKALKYLKIIERRMEDQDRLKEQME